MGGLRVKKEETPLFSKVIDHGVLLTSGNTQTCQSL